MKHVPNILSIIRIMIAPVMVVIYFTLEKSRIYVALLYLLASATDVIDGYIARRYDAITNLGRILDPMGDKLMSVSLIGCLAVDGRAPLWTFVLLFLKELLQTIGSSIIGSKMKFEMPASGILGKASTVCIFLAGTLFLLVDVPRPLMDYIAAGVMVISISAFFSYYLTYRKLIRQFHREHPAN